MEVCGIDPGLRTSGYAIVRPAGERCQVLDAGVCRSDDDLPLAARLAQIEADFTEMLAQWRPRVMGVEQLYAHYRHPRTAILMGHARGVMLSVASRLGIEVRSYPATQVKRFLTGNGRASKAQVQAAIATTLRLPALPDPPDVADALAVALCCCRDVAAAEKEVPVT